MTKKFDAQEDMAAYYAKRVGVICFWIGVAVGAVGVYLTMVLRI